MKHDGPRHPQPAKDRAVACTRTPCLHTNADPHRSDTAVDVASIVCGCARRFCGPEVAFLVPALCCGSLLAITCAVGCATLRPRQPSWPAAQCVVLTFACISTVYVYRASVIFVGHSRCTPWARPPAPRPTHARSRKWRSGATHSPDDHALSTSVRGDFFGLPCPFHAR